MTTLTERETTLLRLIAELVPYAESRLDHGPFGWGRLVTDEARAVLADAGMAPAEVAP